MPFSKEFVWLLECGHYALWDDSKATEIVVCTQCRDFKNVVERVPGYKVNCLDCRVSRRFGLSRISAGNFASRHARRYPTHRVITHLGGKIIERPINYNLVTLFDDPPF